MTDHAHWPPTPAELDWRPPLSDATAVDLDVELLTDGDGGLLPWAPDPSEVEQVPAYLLAYVETDAGRPGGGGASWVYAVRVDDGPLRIHITNDDAMFFEPVVEQTTELPTLGELLRILDGPEDDAGVGHTARVMSDLDDQPREPLRGFMRMESELYPMLAALDRARLEQWIAERP